MPKAIDIELIILLPNDRFGLIASFHESPLMMSFSLPPSFFMPPLCYSPSAITSGSLRDPFGMRAQSCPILHAHSPAPRFSPHRPHHSISTHSFTDILSAFIQNRLQSQKSSREVLPVRQKCVPLHSLSEREAQATSEWIFDRLRTANKTRQR